MTRARGRVHAVVRLRVIFSPSPDMPRLSDVLQPAPCLPQPACFEARPNGMAGHASLNSPRHPPRPRFHFAKDYIAPAI